MQTVEGMQESNPMMGLRGCRLGLLYPEITEMQVRAIFEAAIDVAGRGIKVLPEIMIPLVGHVNELKVARQELESVAKAVMKKAGVEIDYKFGTMIEIPRACLTANQIAEHAEFFSFGTNDLTQMTFGYSRDDAEGKFLHRYLDGVETDDGEKVKILQENPFEVLDFEGVGKLMKIAVEYGQSTKPDIKLGICGEHGGEPQSIAFADSLGLNHPISVRHLIELGHRAFEQQSETPIAALCRLLEAEGYTFPFAPTFVERIFHTYFNHMEIFHAYQLKPYNGKITVYAAEASKSAEKGIERWKTFVSGSVESIVVPGTHHTLLNPEHVEKLATALEQQLQAVQPEASEIRTS